MSKNRSTRSWSRLEHVLAVAALAFFVAACGGAAREHSRLTTGVASGAAPLAQGPLARGRYVTSVFAAPSVMLDIRSSDWTSYGEDAEGFDLGHGPESAGTSVSLNMIHTVYARGPACGRSWGGSNIPRVEAPADMVGWLRGHPCLRSLSGTRTVRIGGATGVQWDAEVVHPPAPPPGGACPSRCVALFQLGALDSPTFLYHPERERFIVLNVGGRAVTILVSAPPRSAGAFFREAERVLHSMRFG